MHISVTVSSQSCKPAPKILSVYLNLILDEPWLIIVVCPLLYQAILILTRFN